MKKILLLLTMACSFQLIQAQSPMCAYLLDGNGNDTTAGANHLTFNNVSYTNDIAGVSNHAGLFNGVNSYALIPSTVWPSVINEFRFSMWFKTNAHQVGGGLAFFGAETVGNYVSNYTPLLYIDTFGKLNTFMYDGSVVPLKSAVPVNDDQWHHALVSYSINTVSGALQQGLFLDGNMVDYRSSTIGGTPSIANFYIGACCARGIGDVPEGWMYFNGSIDEVHAYHDVLSSGTWENLLFRLTSMPASQTVDSAGMINMSISCTNFLSTSRTCVWKKDGVVLASFDTTSLVIPSAMFTDSGRYTVEVSNSSGKTCTSYSALVAVLDTSNNGGGVATSIISLSSNNLLTYPNPTTDYVQINASQNYALEIYDIGGEKIMTGFANQLLSVQDLTAGTYFVKLSDKDNSYFTKFIKR